MTMNEPKTIPELLDAAQDGQAFGAVIEGMFKALEKVRLDEHDE